MNSNTWKKGSLRAWIAVAIMVIIAIIIGASMSSGSPKGPKKTGTGLSDDIPTAQQDLSVTPEDVPKNFCDDLLKKADAKFVTLSDDSETPVFEAGSTHLVGTSADKRLWSDATNVPLSPQTLEAEQTTVCHDPAQAAMVMNGLGGEMVGDKSIFELNSSWMAAQGSPEVIAQWAQQCLVKDDVDKYLACYKTMSTTAYLLGTFRDKGVARAATVWNYHLAGPVAGKVPPFELNPKQYKGYFLAVSYTTKTGSVCLNFGFNVGKSKPNGGDQRLARLACKKPPTTTTSTCDDKGNCPTPPPPGCKEKGNCPTPPPPGCKEKGNCPTPPPCPCVKPTDVVQPVPTPDPGPSGVPTHAPSAQPTNPVNTQSPAPPTPGGNNGGSTQQPGHTASPTPVVPSSDPTNSGDPGGF